MAIRNIELGPETFLYSLSKGVNDKRMVVLVSCQGEALLSYAAAKLAKNLPSDLCMQFGLFRMGAGSKKEPQQFHKGLLWIVHIKTREPRPNSMTRGSG